MSSTPYIELHAHSAFSFLDGASLPEELVAAAVEHGHSALALTDHDNLSGAMEFAQAAKGLGLRAIHGCELSLSGGSHLTLLVEDASWRGLAAITCELNCSDHCAVVTVSATGCLNSWPVGSVCRRLQPEMFIFTTAQGGLCRMRLLPFDCAARLMRANLSGVEIAAIH